MALSNKQTWKTRMTTINNIQAILKVAHLAQDAVLLEGKHGIGKSAIIQQFADNNDMYMFPLFLSTQETGDLIGIPSEIVVDGHKVTQWSKPIWLNRMEEMAKSGKHCVLFLDELNRAPLDVRQSALQLVLEGKIHEHALPRVNGLKSLVIAAINPSDDYQVQELDPALLDRFLCLNVEVSAKDWLKYARENGVIQVIIDFISEFQNRLHFTPAEGKGPTPRAWDKLSQLLKNVDGLTNDVIFDIIRGRLGSDVGAQFFGYYMKYTEVVKTDDIENFIAELDDSAKDKNPETLGIDVANEFSKIEAIRKLEIAAELCERHINKETAKIALVYLYSLELETCVSFLKDMKGSNKETYTGIVAIDRRLNNKKLFSRIVELIKN